MTIHRLTVAAILLVGGIACAAGLAQQPAPPRPGNRSDQPAPGDAATRPGQRLRERMLEGVTPTKDIEYAKPNGKPLLLDIFEPKDAAADAKYPLVIWIHGGGWQNGSKENCPALSLVKQGYVVASINYRLTDVACWPAQIFDCKAAVRFLRAHADEHHIDQSKVGVWGASAGGHLVAMLGTSGGVKQLEGDLGCADQSSKVQCVCDWFGPSDFNRMANAETAAGGAVPKLLCGPVAEQKDTAKAASPVTYCTKDDPPFLIMHGDQDHLVPLQQSEILRDELKKAGVDVRLDVIEGAGHGVKGFDAPAVIKGVQAFFDKQLKRPAPEAKSPVKTGKPGAPRPVSGP